MRLEEISVGEAGHGQRVTPLGPPRQRGRRKNNPGLLGEGQEGAHGDDRRGVNFDRVRTEDLKRVMVGR